MNQNVLRQRDSLICPLKIVPAQFSFIDHLVIWTCCCIAIAGFGNITFCLFYRYQFCRVVIILQHSRLSNIPHNNRFEMKTTILLHVYFGLVSLESCRLQMGISLWTLQFVYWPRSANQASVRWTSWHVCHDILHFCISLEIISSCSISVSQS